MVKIFFIWTMFEEYKKKHLIPSEINLSFIDDKEHTHFARRNFDFMSHTNNLFDAILI